jgi:fructokinase
VTQIGTDACGALLRAHLEANGARLVLAGPANVPTSREITHVDATGAASYRFELNWDVRDVRLADNSAGLHVGSLGIVLAPRADPEHAGALAFPGRPAFVRLTAARLRRGGMTDG